MRLHRCLAILTPADGSDTSSPPSSPTRVERTLTPSHKSEVDPWLALDAEIRAEVAAPWADDYDALPTSPTTIAINLIRLELFPVTLLSEIVPPRTVGASWASSVVSEFPRPPWNGLVFRSPSASKTLRGSADRRLTIWSRPAAHGRFLRSVATVDEE